MLFAMHHYVYIYFLVFNMFSFHNWSDVNQQFDVIPQKVTSLKAETHILQWIA